MTETQNKIMWMCCNNILMLIKDDAPSLKAMQDCIDMMQETLQEVKKHERD